MAALGDSGPFLGGTDLSARGADGVRVEATAWAGSPPGQADGIVLLHGLSQQRRFWGPVARRLLSGPSPRPLAAIDLRGHGDSACPVDSDFAPAACATDVLAVVDELGWERATVVGHSWGAAVALEVAAADPVRTHAVVAVDGGITGPADLGPRDEVRAALTPPRIAVPVADLPALLRSGSLGPWWSPEVEQALLPTFESGEDGLARTRIGFDRHMAVLDGLMAHDVAGLLPAVAAPAWVVSCEPAPGEDRAHASPGWQAAREAGVERAARLLPRPRLQRWAGAIHDVPLQWPALVAGLVLAAAEEDGA